MKTKNILMLVLMLAVVILAGCSSQAPQEQEVQAEINEEGVSASADTNDNGVADVAIEANAGTVTEVTIDLDDVGTDDVDTGDMLEGFCTPGETYTYGDGENSVDARIIGLETYKGSEFCKAQSTTSLTTSGIDITTDTTYYFDNRYSEFWIITTVSNSMMPTPQTSEIHLVDGEVQ